MCASPQREDGHLDIANELVEQLAKLDLSGSEWRLLWVIWRKTWAWHKKEDWISLSQFEKLTGLSRWGVCKAKKALVNKCLLLSTKNGLMFNKNYDGWVGNKMRPQSTKRQLGSQQNGNLLGNKMRHTKETNTKETITKETSEQSSLSDKEDKRLTLLLYELIITDQPSFKKPNLEKWAVDINRMRRIDKRTPEQIEYVIKWARANNFWQANILSAKKLREKFDVLVAQIQRESKSNLTIIG